MRPIPLVHKGRTIVALGCAVAFAISLPAGIVGAQEADTGHEVVAADAQGNARADGHGNDSGTASDRVRVTMKVLSFVKVDDDGSADSNGGPVLEIPGSGGGSAYFVLDGE